MDRASGSAIGSVGANGPRMNSLGNIGELSANMLRVVRGAGKAYELLVQM